MGTEITFTLPDAVFRQIEAVAQRTQRQISDVLVDVVAEAFPRVYVSPDRERMEAEERAYERQRPTILAHYEGEYVAILGGEVVDHDVNEMELVARIQSRFPDDIVHIRLVTQKLQPELRFRSPRFIDRL